MTEGSNPLMQAAQPLLAAATQFRWLVSAPDLAALQRRLIDGVDDFDRVIRAAGVGREDQVASRYLICAFVDDIAAATPWGATGGWAPYALLAHFQRDTHGGERVFQLLSRLAETPGPRRAVLELFHVCLSLGLEGRYRGQPNAERALQEIRARLFRLLFPGSPGEGAGSSEPLAATELASAAALPSAASSPHASPSASPSASRSAFRSDASAPSGGPPIAAPASMSALSSRWQAAALAPVPAINQFPLWAILSVIAGVVLVVYAGLNLWLSSASDRAFATIRSVRFESLASAPVGGATLRQAVTGSALSDALADDVRARRLLVREDTSQSVVSIPTTQLFEPGTASLTEGAVALLDRISTALANQSGPILVSSYADAGTARSTLFPSVWHLTDAQARAVSRHLRATLPPTRPLQAEGLGDQDAPVPPLASGGSGETAAAAAGPATDPSGPGSARRVDIATFPGR